MPGRSVDYRYRYALWRGRKELLTCTRPEVAEREAESVLRKAPRAQLRINRQRLERHPNTGADRWVFDSVVWRNRPGPKPNAYA